MLKQLTGFLFFLFVLQPLFGQQNEFSLYLIGDAGEEGPVRDKLKQALKKNYDATVPSVVIFLGDNIYPKGMPLEGEKDREEAQQILESQIGMVESFRSEIIFVPGNHDWKKGKSEGLERILEQAKWISHLDSLDRRDIEFFPQGGCPGPVEVPLSNNLVLAIIDSQWFLHPWDKPEGDDSPCDVKYPADMVVKLEDILERNKGKRIVVAAHHPIYTYGEHGGVFTVNNHLFPLLDLNKKLYIPLPIVGSLYPLYRTIIGDIQDTQHPVNKRYRQVIASLLEKYPGTIYANGHEHALQYSTKDDVHYVTSGSGSKNTFVKEKGYARFVSDANGFVRIDIKDNGSTALHYFTIADSVAAFEKELYPIARNDRKTGSNTLPDFSKAVTVHASDHYVAGRFRRRTLGENYRAEWRQELNVNVFDIGTQNNGMKILQRGGGMQTLSLRLADSTGHEFALRSIEKFPEKAVPEILQKTFAQDLVQDQISAAHPYGALVIPGMAEAVGIYHTNPKLVYIPDDPRLGIYRKEFANTLSLFEERPDGDASNQASFGNAKKIISTDKVLQRLQEDPDNHVDQEFALRSRLFDMVIGDWDRHDDQWRWAVFKEKKSELYRPIPRDRDQAFFVSNGWLSKVWSRRWALPKFEGFNETIRWAPGFMFNGRYFDRSFLNELTIDSWLKQTQEIRKSLTDEVIEKSIHEFPQPIYSLHGDAIIRKIKSRRDRLPEYAVEYYKFLAREVDVPGSDQGEWFKVDFLEDGDTKLVIHKTTKAGEPGEKVYERIFRAHETKELRLYGRGGKDIFEFTGNQHSPIEVRVIGGEGKDSVVQQSHNKVLLYDFRDGINYSDNRHIGNRTSSDPAVNVYDRKSFQYPRLAPLVYGNYNYDDGLFIGGGFLYTTHGFRKEPYKSQHLFLGSYAIKTHSYNFKYDGRFNQVIGMWGLKIDADVKAPNFVNNFFGWGNETKFNTEIDEDPNYNELEHAIDYYRIRLRQIDFQLSFTRAIGKTAFIEFGPAFQRAEIEKPRSDQRYIYEYAATLPEPLFEVSHYFGGLQWSWGINHTDNLRLPTRGLVVLQRSLFMKGIDGGAGDFASHNAALAVYQTFKLPARVTFAFRVGGGKNQGTYELYQAQILDGKTELRGFRKTRFYGDSRFYSNNEVRIKLASIRTYLFPASFGINGFFDVGRVWYKDANGVDPSVISGTSSLWHTGIGAGLWFTPFNLTVLSTEFAHSKDGNMAYIRLGFLF